MKKEKILRVIEDVKLFFIVWAFVFFLYGARMANIHFIIFFIAQIMEKTRFNLVGAIFGRRGSGKTEYLKGNKEFNLKGFLKTAISKGQKVLIIDTIDHPSYSDIPVIKQEQLKGWKKGIYRIYFNPDDMKEFIIYLNQLRAVWNTLIVFEDAYKHQADKLDKALKQLMIDSKQKNIDILFMYHAFSMAPKDLYRMIDFIEVFKTKDHPSTRGIDMIGYYDEALAVYEEVKKHPSKFYHKLINTEL